MAIVTLDDYINTAVAKVLSNQTLCKLLYYDVDNPLSQSDIADTSILVDKDNPDRRIFAIPFNPDVHAKQKTTLHIEVNQSEKASDVFYKNININFIIFCHNHLWELATDSVDEISLRPNKMVTELFTLFYNKRTIGIGSPYYAELQNLFLNDEVAGYGLSFENVDFSQNS